MYHRGENHRSIAQFVQAEQEGEEPGTDAATGATHIGAVLTPVSQYPGEAETLFPPLTMLEVLKDEGAGEFMIYEKEHTKAGGEKVVVKEIHVAPSFVHQV